MKEEQDFFEKRKDFDFFLLFFKFGRKMSVFYGISDRYEFGTNG